MEEPDGATVRFFVPDPNRDGAAAQRRARQSRAASSSATGFRARRPGGVRGPQRIMRAAGAIAAAEHGVTPIGILTAVAVGTTLGAEATVDRPSNEALAAANHARSRVARLIIKIHPAASTIGNHGRFFQNDAHRPIPSPPWQPRRTATCATSS